MIEGLRFAFLVTRDGLAAALEFERENVMRTYRRVVLSRFTGAPKMTMYRRGLIERYVEAKRILREHAEERAVTIQ